MKSIKQIINKQSAALLAGVFSSASAFAASGGDTSLPMVGFLDKFADLLTGTVANFIALIALVLVIITYIITRQNEDMSGLFKAVASAGLTVCALCGVGQLFSWMGYGALI
ncbi:MAG TPA: hypothetical protein IAC45_05165 [Candidatus Aphodousia faecavium]|nr:hypothetical protein [Candidatus Aphodousia faecavium]